MPLSRSLVAQAAEIEAIRCADAALGRKPRPRSWRPRDPPGPHVDPPCPSRDLLVIPRGLPVSPLDPHLATSRPSCGNRSDTVATMGSKGLPGRPPGITKRSRQGHEASTGGPGRSRGAQSEGEVSGRELRQPAVSLLFPQPGRLVARWGSKGLTGRPPRVTKRSREGHEGSRDAPGGSRASQSEGEVSGRVLRQPAVSLLFSQPGRLVANGGSKGGPGGSLGSPERGRGLRPSAASAYRIASTQH
eukprot:gene13375-biopygen2275